jgi:hypothetical protein
MARSTPLTTRTSSSPARWSSGEIIPLFFPTMFSLSRWRSSSSQLFCATNATGCGTRRDWGEEGGPAGLLSSGGERGNGFTGWHKVHSERGSRFASGLLGGPFRRGSRLWLLSLGNLGLVLGSGVAGKQLLFGLPPPGPTCPAWRWAPRRRRCPQAAPAAAGDLGLGIGFPRFGEGAERDVGAQEREQQEHAASRSTEGNHLPEVVEEGSTGSSRPLHEQRRRDSESTAKP